MAADPVDAIQCDSGIVGRGVEIRLALACLSAGRNLMLEGPVGVGKSALAEALASHLGREMFRVDGDERYTEQKMTGWFDPALVLKGGYQREYFIEGPLVRAMRSGGVLFINEINRMPESVQNVLLPAMEERRVVAPQLGEVPAEDSFLIVATQNPVEFVATSHLSEALVDRFEFVQLDYQSEEEEIEIVRRNIHARDAKDLDELIRRAVSLMRLTRSHPKVRRGASVRAAMGMVDVAARLGGLAGLEQAALVSLLHRIEIAEESGQSAEAVVREICEESKKKLLLS
ncbi:MAG TPA: MoxR family ATPase [Sumerlaeia bacterium]|nr:MoxR family ATPase [Sumerlaeia bacterium]